MNDPSIDQEILDRLHKLPAVQQRRVLSFVRVLSSRQSEGMSVQDLLPFVGILSQQEAADWIKAIEEGCEQVDVNEW